MIKQKNKSSGRHPVTTAEINDLITEVEQLKAEIHDVRVHKNTGLLEQKAEIKKLREALEKARIKHLVVDGDCWFSCPKSGECCNDNAPDECNCGADRHNQAIDEALKGDSP